MRCLSLLCALSLAAKAPEALAPTPKANADASNTMVMPPPAVPNTMNPFFPAGKGPNMMPNPAMMQMLGGQLASLSNSFTAGANRLPPNAFGGMLPSISGIRGGAGGEFQKVFNASIPAPCASSLCSNLVLVPWSMMTKSACLELMTTFEACLLDDSGCKTQIVLNGPRACCDSLQGGTSPSTPCSTIIPSTINSSTTVATTANKSPQAGKNINPTATTPTTTTLSPETGNFGKGKAGKMGKAKGKAGKAKGKNAVSVPPAPEARVAPAGPPSCACFESMSMNTETMDKSHCVQQVSALQQCMVSSGCKETAEVKVLSACCEMLPGGSGFNPACANPAAVFSSFMQSSAGQNPQLAALLGGLDINSLIQMGQQMAGFGAQMAANRTG